MKQNRAVEIWVGLFVGLGMAALVASAFYVGNLSSYNSDSGYKLEARFDEIGGLKARSPVTISGVQVGRVISIHLDNQEYRAVVRMEIDPEKLPLQQVGEEGEQTSTGSYCSVIRVGSRLPVLPSSMRMPRPVSSPPVCWANSMSA